MNTQQAGGVLCVFLERGGESVFVCVDAGSMSGKLRIALLQEVQKAYVGIQTRRSISLHVLHHSLC
jgi:hypothetical protein